MENQKKSFFSNPIIGIAIFALIGFGIYYLFMREPSFYVVMQKEADKINALTPIDIGPNMIFDSAVAFSDNRYQYNYTIIGADKFGVDMVEFKEKLRLGILDNVKTDSFFRIFHNQNTLLEFVNYDESGEHIVTVKLTPEEYDPTKQ